MIVIFSIVAIGVGVFVLWLYYSAYAAIPPQFRQMEPGQVFMVLIPLYGAVWIFFVVMRLSRSFRAYFNSIGRYDLGDCGERTGLTALILQWLGVIPFVGALASLASLVMMIIYLVKISQFKNMVRFHEAQGLPHVGAMAAAPGYGPPPAQAPYPGQPYQAQPYQQPGAYPYAQPGYAPPPPPPQSPAAQPPGQAPAHPPGKITSDQD